MIEILSDTPEQVMRFIAPSFMQVPGLKHFTRWFKCKFLLLNFGQVKNLCSFSNQSNDSAMKYLMLFGVLILLVIFWVIYVFGIKSQLISYYGDALVFDSTIDPFTEIPLCKN